MSYDLAVWEGDRPADDRAALGSYKELIDRWHGDETTKYLLARMRGEQTPTDPTPAIRSYVEALLKQWPDITTDEGAESPWSDGPLMNNATGPLFYFGMVWSQAEEASDFAARLAVQHGLVCFDPQMECLRP